MAINKYGNFLNHIAIKTIATIDETGTAKTKDNHEADQYVGVATKALVAIKKTHKIDNPKIIK